MTHTLVSFIGRSTRRNAAGGYEPTRYKFPNGNVENTAHFGWALMQRGKPDRMVILGTSGSMWDYLVEGLGLGNDAEDLRLTLMERVQTSSVSQDLLDQIAPIVSQRAGSGVRLTIVPYGADPASQVEVLNILAQSLLGATSVSLDVTHALRHLPMIALMGIFQLRAIRPETVVHDIWYGSFDENSRESTVYKLDGLQEIAEWTHALAVFDASGDFSRTAPLLALDGLPRHKETALRDAAFFERTSRDRSAKGKIHEVFPLTGLTGISKLFAPALEARLAWVHEERMYQRQRALARRYLDAGDFLRASIFMLEASVTRNIQQADGTNVGSYDEREQAREAIRTSRNPDFKLLSILRNAMCHGVEPSAKEGQSAMRNEATLRRALNDLLTRLLPD